MKKLSILLIALVLILGITGCGSNESKEIKVIVNNTVENRVKAIALNFLSGGEVKFTQAVNDADGLLLNKDAYTFTLTKEDIKNLDLSDFTIEFYITDKNDVRENVLTTMFEAQKGMEYTFSLVDLNGVLNLWQEIK